MLETLTLMVLAVVLLTKYFAVKHMQSLTEEKNALQQVVDEYEHRFKRMQATRKEKEKEFQHLKRDRFGLETFLQRQHETLITQQEKIRDLENLII